MTAIEIVQVDAIQTTGDTSQDRRAVLDFAVAGFLARYRVKTTRDGYALALRQWFQWCNEHFVDPLTARRAHVELFARELELTGRRQSTVAAKLNALSGFYKLACADELIAKDPMVGVRRPQIDRVSTTNGLTRPELADLINAAEKHGTLQDQALICLLAFNGLRVSEALGMDAAHFERFKGQLVVNITRKYGKVQPIPLAPRTLWAVERLIHERGGVGPIFLSREGNRMDRAAAGRVVKRIAKHAGITKRMHSHVLRHAFVSICRDAGVLDADIIASTGHADVRMCSYYDRHTDSIHRNATHTVAAFVERAT